MSEQTTSIVLAGVGGQGILLACEIAANAAIEAGFDVKTNEVHGMAQRGGSVIGQIRYGQKVNSPLILEGTANVLAGLEQTEALRYAHYLAPGGLAVVSAQRILPVTVSSGQATYPDDVPQRLAQAFDRLVYLQADKLALSLGNVRCANVVLLGAMSRALDLPTECWQQSIRRCVPPKHHELNLKAFELGQSQQ